MKKMKTEHSGAKNGGGHWGSREEAKALSKRARRRNQKNEIREISKDLDARTRKVSRKK